MAHFAERVRAAAIDIRLLIVGLIVDPTFADQLVAGGRADLVGVGRAFLDDPHWALHAAQRLGHALTPPKPYHSVGARWPGHALLRRT
jgi:2,4-dienoyl-CoA reductase-like NADH-dependent reductase (Old Yellow Enzyme family)